MRWVRYVWCGHHNIIYIFLILNLIHIKIFPTSLNCIPCHSFLSFISTGLYFYSCYLLYFSTRLTYMFLNLWSYTTTWHIFCNFWFTLIPYFSIFRTIFIIWPNLYLFITITLTIRPTFLNIPTSCFTA